MPALQTVLKDFFDLVAQQQPAVLTIVKEYEKFTMQQARWQFTLPDLHQFLKSYNAAFEDISYSQFRSAVFASPINQSIKKYGAEITVTSNQGKVDESVYALIWH